MVFAGGSTRCPWPCQSPRWWLPSRRLTAPVRDGAQCSASGHHVPDHHPCVAVDDGLCRCGCWPTSPEPRHQRQRTTRRMSSHLHGQTLDQVHQHPDHPDPPQVQANGHSIRRHQDPSTARRRVHHRVSRGTGHQPGITRTSSLPNSPLSLKESQAIPPGSSVGSASGLIACASDRPARVPSPWSSGERLREVEAAQRALPVPVRWMVSSPTLRGRSTPVSRTTTSPCQTRTRSVSGAPSVAQIWNR